MSSPLPPPDHNPVLTAYESFVRTTPLITRYALTTLTATYALSFVVDPTMSLSCVPMFVAFRFEIYRIVLSPFLCTSGITLIFAYISLMDAGKRLELGLGSARFAVLMLTIGTASNVSFLILYLTLFGMTGNPTYALTSSHGIWIVLLGLISMESASAPAGSRRRILSWELDAAYYPLILLGAFTLMGGFQATLFLGSGIGYAYGRGKLEALKVSDASFRRWEDGCLRNFARRPGWAAGHGGGSDTWLPLNAPNREGGGGGGFDPSALFGGRSGGGREGGASSPSASVGVGERGNVVGLSPGPVAPPGDPAASSAVDPSSSQQKAFSGSGRSLGGSGGSINPKERGQGSGLSPSSEGPSIRRNLLDARHRALEAAEKRAKNSSSVELVAKRSDGGGDGNNISNDKNGGGG